MSGSVDLAARTGGLVPIWLFLLLVVGWLLVILYFGSRRARWPDRAAQFAAMGSLLLANVLYFWRPLFTGAHMPQGGGDLNSFFFTLHAYSAERITNGELSLWNPYLHGGMPQLANFQAGLLYPPNLIAYLVSSPFSYGTLESLAILHYLIASLGGYLLLRALGAGRIGAVTGGLIFAYGGFFVAHLGHYSMISAAAWVPWLFWAVYRLVERPSWWTGAGLSGLVFLCATGGHQQTLLFALIGMSVWWLYLMAFRAGVRIPGVGREVNTTDVNHRAWGRIWSRVGAASIVQFVLGTGSGLLLAAPMILPSLQLASRSVRSTLSFDQASEFSVQPVALLHLILPTVFGSNPTDYWGAFSSGEIWGYVGVSTLVVAAIGIALQPSAHRIFFAALTLLALIYALGPAAPVHGWFYQFIPGFDLVRAPARAYLFLNLALAVLAGFAVSDLSRRVFNPGFHVQQVLTGGIRFLMIVVGASTLIIIPFFYTQILGVNDPPNRPVITVENLWMMVLFLSMLLGALWLARTGAVRGAALGLILAAILLLDLFSATMPFNPTDEDLVASYRDPEVTQFLEEQWAARGPFRIDVRHPGLLPNFGVTSGIHNANGVYDPMQPAAYATLHNLLLEQPDNRAYNLLNVQYWVLPAEEQAPDGFERVFQSGAGTQIWEHLDALPRAWFASEVIDVVHDAQVEVLRESGFDPSEAVLIQNPPVDADESSSGDVELTRYSPERIEIAVDSDGPGYVVISDGVYPGWSAEIDGEPAKVFTANYGIRAIPVDAQSEQIELVYDSDYVTLGLMGAGLGGLVLVGMIAGPIVLGRLFSSAPNGDD